ncbi:hypothetical protein FHS85_001598 [Rhodoligotrophos appendicifer]|uniref:hypothetical protein n=1 Tax=Rhodoligotrophos appendicifer TaxID=987056 RepID=UPI00118574D0|nr:hypothetical protein [Rhodoligotrophos appendicifer]
MKMILGTVSLALLLTSLSASAQLMEDERVAIEGACGEAIMRYCPRVDRDDFSAIWSCLSPHFMQISPYCKGVLQNVQDY